MRGGAWRRTGGRGWESVWAYSVGPRFLVDMHAHGCGRYLACWVDGVFTDENHLVDGPAVGKWIQGCWRRHVAGLPWHERMDYVHLLGENLEGVPGHCPPPQHPF